MKKLLSMLLASVMLVAIPCQGSSIDWASMSDSELQDAIDSARTELYQRKQREENGNLIVCDAEGVQVVFTGIILHTNDKGLQLESIVINNSEYTIHVTASKGYMNGWEVDTAFTCYSLKPKMKYKTTCFFTLSDAMLTDISEIEDVSVVMSVSSTEPYKSLFESPEMQIFMDDDKVVSVQEIYTIG